MEMVVKPNIWVKRKKLPKSDALAALFFILPSFLGFAVFFLFPVLSSLVMSFFKWNLTGSVSDAIFNGLKNYEAIFKDQAFTASMRNSLLFTASTVLLGIVISIVLATLITKTVYNSGALKTMFFVPYISSTIAIAAVWQILFNPTYGPINGFLRSIGFESTPNWLVDFNWALTAIMIIYIWQNLGYNIVVFIAGLSAVPTDLYEAAEVDGASKIRQFFTITIPMVSPTTFFLVIMGVINSFKVFDLVQVLTGGGPGNATSMLAVYIYKEGFKYYRTGTASAAAWIMFIIIFAVTIIQWHGQKKWVTYE